MRPFARLLPWSLLMLAAGCNPRPVTEVVLVVHTTYEVPGALDRIRITASPSGSRERQTSEGLWADAREPRTLGLVYDGGDLGLDVNIEGMRGGMTLVERAATFSFVIGQIRRLDVWLVPECARMRCGMETCDLGACRPVEVAATELAVWTGSVGDHDGGLRIDAVDAGAPLDVSTPVDAGAPVDAVTPADAWDCCGSRLENVTAPSCRTGTCTFMCQDRFGDCDGNRENGCEQTLTMDGHCGRCARSCSPMERCTAGGMGMGAYQCQR